MKWTHLFLEAVFLGAFSFSLMVRADEGPARTFPLVTEPAPKSDTGPISAPGHSHPATDVSQGAILEDSRAELRTPPITVELWARLRDASQYNVMIASDVKASSLHWELYSGLGNGFLSVNVPGFAGDIRSQAFICDNAWHYLAATLGDGSLSLYVDGKLVRRVPMHTPKGKGYPGDIAIGQTVEGNPGCNGLVQDVRISKGVRKIEGVPSAPFAKDAATLALWPLDGAAMPAANTDTNDPIAEQKSAAADLNLTAADYLAPRDNLPQYKIIPAATKDELTPSNGWPSPDSFKTWTRSHGGPAGTRYAAFDQINKQNVKNLTVAWTYHSGDGTANPNIECNPIIVDGLIYLPTSGNRMVALDGATGKELWRYVPEVKGIGLEDVPARRGLVYWPGDKANPARILFTMGTYLYALDPKTGKPIETFGDHGRSRLPPGGVASAPAVYQNVLICPGYLGNVLGYDVRSGIKLWIFNTLPTGDEPGADTWGGTQREGANDWGGMALDESRGIAYVATGSPKPNFIGYHHTGDDLYGNCVIALNALTGRYLWHFQEVRHDVWDLDIPSPPVLVTVMRDGMKVDAVAQVTKIGNTLLLDRVTGKPLFPFRLRRAPAFKLPGDVGAPYQPDVQLPEPFTRQEFTLNDVTNIDPQSHDAVMKQVEKANLGWFVPFEEGKASIYFGIHGGAEWTGAAADPQGRLYVTATELPWIEGVYQLGAGAEAKTPDAIAGKQVFEVSCAACHGAQLQGNGVAPSLLGLANRMNEDGFLKIMAHGRNGMPPQLQLTGGQTKHLMAFLLAKSAGGTDGPASKPSGQWTDMGYSRLLDPHDYPGCRPPWGTLTCLDLNTGKIAWKVPLGEYPELKAKGIPKTGTENFGGATVTSGGVVFASGTRDSQIRAFDADTGEELWKHDLPLHGTAPPAVYEVKGREYVLLPATGGGKLGGLAGDAWVAFALGR